jgi:rubrerythrin
MARNARNQQRQGKNRNANPRRNQGGAARENARGGIEGKFELDNLTYDLIAAVHKKSEALEVYDKYIQDAGRSEAAQLFEQIREDDQEHIRQLSMLLRDRFRGETGSGGEMEEEEAA